MEALGRMIYVAVSGGLLDGFSEDNVAGFVFSHHLFADDTLSFCGAHPTHLHHLRCLFLYFEVASGLRLIWPSLNWFMWVMLNM